MRYQLTSVSYMHFFLLHNPLYSLSLALNFSFHTSLQKKTETFSSSYIPFQTNITSNFTTFSSYYSHKIKALKLVLLTRKILHWNHNHLTLTSCNVPLQPRSSGNSPCFTSSSSTKTHPRFPQFCDRVLQSKGHFKGEFLKNADLKQVRKKSLVVVVNIAVCFDLTTQL